MNLTTAIAKCFKKYVTFVGRAPRSEYWYFYLFYVLALIGSLLMDSMINPQLGEMSLLYLITALVLFLPSLSVAVRRLHDIDRSGWWLLLLLLPLIGAIVMIIWVCKGGTQGENKYGGNPLAA